MMTVFKVNFYTRLTHCQPRSTIPSCATFIPWTLMQQLSIDPYVMIAEEVYNVLERIESNLKKNIFNN